MSMLTQILKPVGIYDASGIPIGSTGGGLNVAIVSGSISVGTADKTIYTYGSSAFLPVGGVFQDTAPQLTAGQSGSVRLTAYRGSHSNLRDSSGIELLGQKLMAGSIPVVLASDQSTLPVSAASLPLPTGAATSALQSTGNASLASIDSKIPAQGAALIAASLPVNIASNQVVPISASALPLPAGASTSALQSTISGQLPATLGQKVMASSMAVVIASDQSTLPVSGTITVTGVATAANQTNGNQITQVSVLPSIPTGSNNIGSITNITGTVSLPTGASTSALQTSGNSTLTTISGQLPLSLGQKVMASSLAVTLASDQSTLPVSVSSLPLPAGAATSALQTTGNTSLSSIDSKTPALGQALAAASVPVVLTAAQLTTLTPLTSVAVTQATAASLNATVVGTGTFAVQAAQSGTWNITNVSGTVSLPTGAATSALQTTISGQLPATLGQKTMANSMAVVLASDQSSIATVQGGRSKVGSPVYNVYSSTNITTGAYVQLVASSASAINFLDIFDSSGQAMILAVGGAGSEVIQAYIGPGGEQLPLNIPAGSRISYKALTANATAGYLLFNMYS